MPNAGNAENGKAWDQALQLIEPLLHLGDRDFLISLRSELLSCGLVEAVAQHDTAALYDWLIEMVQFQGISDASAAAYLEANGGVRWSDIADALHGNPRCRRLSSHWAFADCGYHKSALTCTEPQLLSTCPLPSHRLRNGRLSQCAYSLYLFIRDVCDGDLVTWIDRRLDEADRQSLPHQRAASMRNAVLEPMSNIHGVSHKVLSMALADLLLGADPARERWVSTGAHMIVVDTLVHNFLHRSGILHRLGAGHAYGAGCYSESGCRFILERLAAMIDARAFNPAFPRVFPRFVQHAIWRFCSKSGFNICNGNKINDTGRCRNRFCPIYPDCSRRALRVLERSLK